MRKLSKIKLCIVSLLFLMMAGCSGIGESSAPTIFGVAAAGSTLAGTVYLRDSSIPARELSIPITADGSFSFNLEGLTAPFLLKAVGTANGNILTLYSFASASGITNINPLSNLAVSLANGSDDLQHLYTSPDHVKMLAILNALPTAITNVQTVLQPTLAKFGAETLNFISDPYAANHKGIDLFLDMVGIWLNSGYVYISDKQANDRIYMPLNDFNTYSIDIITDPIPTVGSVLVKPDLALVAPNATLNFSTVVVGSANPQVIWKVVEDNGGTITNSGAYTAPATTGNYHVTATNVSDVTKSVTVGVKVSEENVFSIVNTGPGVYTVMANNFVDVVGIEFTITYDATLLANPQVNLGSLATRALLVSNTSLPGALKWAIISLDSISDSGSLVSINFDLLRDSPGRILSMSAKLMNSLGQIVGTTVLIVPPTGTISI